MPWTPTYLLERTQLFAGRTREEVFPFFADAGNLEAITPPWLNFRILTPLPIAMGKGALIDYRLRLFCVPLRWRTRIDLFEPPVRFVDRQLWGPYRLWRHTHEFLETPAGVLMTDRVEYQIPLGPVGQAAHALLVRRLLDQIFAYRFSAIAQFFGPAATTGPGTDPAAQSR